MTGVTTRKKKRKTERVSTISRPASATERNAYSRLITKLAVRRVKMGMSQNDLDVVLGVTIGQVAKWEALDRVPGSFLMACWCSALDLRLEPVDVRRNVS